jgi:catechol 2,3-dioxygenase-like lactoylglutathione lyase family enzyme
MNVTIHSSFLPHTDPDASLAFYRDVLGFEVRLDVGYENLRWITVGPVGQTPRSCCTRPPRTPASPTTNGVCCSS